MECRYEARLAAERESGIRLQGENGVIRSKFSGLTQQLTHLEADLKSTQDSKMETEQVVKLSPKHKSLLL